MSVDLKWYDKELIKKVNTIADSVAKKGADLVLKDAKRFVPIKSGTLKSEIELKRGKFKDGDYFVQAQGPGNYKKFYATFVELGTHNTKKKPFLRPALNRNKSRIQRMFKDAMT